MSGQRIFILYDGRALAGDEDDATIMDTADTEAAARAAGSSWWADNDAIWYEYDFDGAHATNGRPRYDLPPTPARATAQDGE